MFVCCVLSGRGLCDELITRPEESYRLWRVDVCDQETSCDEEAIACWAAEPEKTKQKQCLTVRNLSIKIYRIYVCYTNITLYIAFGIIR
jgi:hypothetical protein